MTATARRTESPACAYAAEVIVECSWMVSEEDARDLIEDAFEAGQKARPDADDVTFRVSSVGNLQRLADLLGLLDLQPGDVLAFGPTGLEVAE